MDQAIDQISFYVLSAFIILLAISTKIVGYRKASLGMGALVCVILSVFLVFGTVAKDIHGVSLPMKEISVFFFGYLKALIPLAWLFALLSSVNQTPLREGAKLEGNKKTSPPAT